MYINDPEATFQNIHNWYQILKKLDQFSWDK